MNVLFIGATGLVGSHVVTFLKDKFQLTLAAFNGGEVEGMPVAPVDIRNWEETEALLQKGDAEGRPFDAVIYCATADYRNANQRDIEGRRQYFENCIDVNARGAFHVFEAAWRARVPRVVHIGSMTSVIGQPRYEVIDAEVRDRPTDLYASTKIFGENVGRSYVYRPVRRYGRPAETEEFSMQVLCLRLGQPFTSVEHWRKSHFKGSRLAVYVGDIAFAMERALLTDVRYGIYPVVSAVEDTWVMPDAYAELGYSPRWRFTPDDLVPITATDEAATDEAATDEAATDEAATNEAQANAAPAKLQTASHSS